MRHYTHHSARMAELKAIIEAYRTLTVEEAEDTGAGDLEVAPLLTGTVALDGVSDAFERLRNNPQDAKILLDPTR